MANTKSAQKQARKNIKRRDINLARKTALKTVTKKLLAAVENNDIAQAKELLKEAEAKFARAKNKHTMHQKTASRKVSRLAQKVAKASK